MSNTITPVFRLAFPAVFKAKLNKMNEKEEYSLVALFKKGEDLTKLKQAAEAAVIKKWPNELPDSIRSPFRDQADRKGTGYEPGAIFMTLKSQEKPGVVDQNVEEIIDTSQVYAGCWCKASINAYAYDQKGNKGVAFGLVNLQKVSDGDPISSRTRATDDFAAIKGTGTPTKDGVADTGAAGSLF